MRFAEGAPSLCLIISPNTCSVSGVICNANNWNVHFKNNEIRVVNDTDAVVYDLSALKYTIVVDDYSDLIKQDNGEIHFRLPMKPCNSVPLRIKSKPTLELVIEQPIARCTCCRHPIYDGSLFQRVLPLPSEGWQDMSDSCFCHESPKDKASRPRGSSLLRPRQADLLVGHSHVLLRRHAVVDGVCEKDGAVLCSSCSSHLGEMYGDEGDVKLYLTSLCLSPSGEDHTSLGDLQIHHLLASYLQEQSDLLASTKFVVNSRTSSSRSQSILLHMFDANHCAVTGVTMDGGKSSLESYDVLVVLYVAYDSRHERLFSEWTAGDIPSLDLPQPVCQKFVSVLQASTEALPTSLSSADHFSRAHVIKAT